MPGRLVGRRAQAVGPRPFSSEWLASDAPSAPVRPPVRLPGWIPSGRALSRAMLVVITLAAAILPLIDENRAMFFSRPSIESDGATSGGSEQGAGAVANPTVTEQITTEPIATEATATELLVAESAGQGSDNLPAPEFAQAPDLAENLAAQLARAPADRPLLPEFRIVMYYGHPHDPAMGVVGEYDIEQLAEILREEAANYAAADPSRPVIPAFEVIATVAQRVPGSDGTYILDTDTETLTTYIDFAAEHGMLVVLDLQVGRGTIAAEIEKVRDLLARPNVHLAIDPEFAVSEGEIPGEYIGSVTAESITYAQEVLAEISVTHGIPPKILIVHQFREDMIQGKDRLAPVPGVQLVIDADGYGAPELKTAVYNFLVRDELIEFSGVKLFYRQDMPLMTPQEILALVPAPNVVIYQ
jgi:hypothetical protein